MIRREALEDSEDYCLDTMINLDGKKFYETMDGNIPLMTKFLRICLKNSSISVIEVKPHRSNPVPCSNPVTFDIKAVDGIGRLMDIELTKLDKAFKMVVSVNRLPGVGQSDLVKL